MRIYVEIFPCGEKSLEKYFEKNSNYLVHSKQLEMYSKLHYVYEQSKSIKHQWAKIDLCP